MKKIGILTYMLNNYGAVLQAFALQFYLKQNNKSDVYNIDFRTVDHDYADKIFKLSLPLNRSTIISLVFTCIRYRDLLKRKKCTWKFKHTYFTFTERYFTEEELLNSPPQMDIFVTGSDQVFNPRGHNQKVYFLDFPKNESIKVAYAASFGSIKTMTPIWESKTFPAIMDFDALSAREIEGAKYLSKITSRTVPCLVDPVFLLEKEQWDTIAIDPILKEKYILVYDLNGGENLISLAQKIKKHNGYRIICITDKITKQYKNCHQIYSAGPAEFVGLFRNADFVITDSFHGIVFSIVYKVKFIAYIANIETSSRIYNLLSLINQTDRIINSPDSITDSILFDSVDADYTKLKEKILQSKNFIDLNFS
jgi:hypothetical protein